MALTAGFQAAAQAVEISTEKAMALLENLSENAPKCSKLAYRSFAFSKSTVPVEEVHGIHITDGRNHFVNIEGQGSSLLTEEFTVSIDSTGQTIMVSQPEEAFFRSFPYSPALSDSSSALESKFKSITMDGDGDTGQLTFFFFAESQHQSASFKYAEGVLQSVTTQFNWVDNTTADPTEQYEPKLEMAITPMYRCDSVLPFLKVSHFLNRSGPEIDLADRYRSFQFLDLRYSPSSNPN